MWAFGYDQQSSNAPEGTRSDTISRLPSAKELWTSIPLSSDIIVTHTPSYTHCDESTSKRRALGCEDLRQALWRVRPKLAVCGHVHEGRGAERVRWDILGTSAAPYTELGVDRWDDPGTGQGNNKMSLVDLTSRGGERPLDNYDDPPARREAREGSREQGGGAGDHSANTMATVTALPGCGTRGVGGNPNLSVRCDRAALCCRMGRRETCVVNCAIAATNWPHTGGKKFNKPIVVDLDLPILEDD